MTSAPTPSEGTDFEETNEDLAVATPVQALGAPILTGLSVCSETEDIVFVSLSGSVLTPTDPNIPLAALRSSYKVRR